ncbi:putative uncharacterized protein [Tannerella sp. CAG:118]|nr:putative uncharacterized protein [Tannerella sp. CAG:118]
MLEDLLELDRTVLLFFNHFHTLYLDQVMWVYTGKIIWLPLIVMLVYVVFHRSWKEGILAALMIILVVTICDQVASSIFKPLFERLRPTRDPDFSQYVTIVNNYRGGKYGFASSHASNGFGLAIFTALLFKNRFYSFTAVLWALITCYSRMYVGVHYPGDILAGIVIGIITSFVVYKYLYLVLHRYLFTKGIYSEPIPVYSHENGARYVALTIYILFFIILVFAPLFNFRVH